MKYKYKKITVIVGHYGCGKTNLAVNMALDMAEQGRVCVVDMDIVNPYFRTADFKELFEEKGIDILCPQYANTNLDIPVLNFDMERIAENYDCVIMDVGGDDAGAYALGRYKKAFEKYKQDMDMLYVFSMYRSVDSSPEDTVQIMREIEQASGMKCTAVVNNSNLGLETNSRTIEKSREFAEKVSELSKLPIAFECSVSEKNENTFPVKRMVKMPWENLN